MKTFNLFIAISLVAILGSLFFFKNGFNQTQSNASDQQKLQMDMSNYLDYSDATLANAQKKGKSILFFAATTWCQTCSALEEEIIERQSEIPSNITILKIDYDKNKTMNQKWSVTSQHTLVLLDQDDQEIKRWLGGGFDTLLQQIQGI